MGVSREGLWCMLTGWYVVDHGL